MQSIKEVRSSEQAIAAKKLASVVAVITLKVKRAGNKA
jgi:hypothetical protein